LLSLREPRPYQRAFPVMNAPPFVRYCSKYKLYLLHITGKVVKSRPVLLTSARHNQ